MASAVQLRTTGRSFLIGDLLKHQAVLVVGPPYSGKSFALRSAKGWLRLGGSGVKVIHRDHRAHSAEWAAAEDSSLRDWQLTSDQLVWFIDSIDECLERGEEFLTGLEDRLQAMTADQRSRLRLIATCRQNDVPEGLVATIREFMGGCLVVRIAPLDREDARAQVGPGFERVCELIRNNGLRDLAAQPGVLTCLGHNRHLDASAGRSRVWRTVIEELIERTVTQVGPVRVARVFEASCRIAFVLTFSDRFEVCTGENSVFATTPSLGQLFGGDLNELLPAARQALRTELFEKTSTGFRVGHRHVREWLTAFQLAQLVTRGDSGQLIELLASGDGRLSRDHHELAAATLEILNASAEG
ncbi:MAG: hypothetical protein Q8N23_05320 [Archangium sp.]|nr:hypothetical protein [Archangium sp.]MDP3574561.1 hypothetical protein [Archangium sp.]